MGVGLSNDRDRRLKATGQWFQRGKKKSLWTNHIFPILLLVSLINYIYWI